MPFMPNSKLPQRDPLVGPPAPYSGAPAEKIELFAGAVAQWADQSLLAQSSRCWAEHEPPEGMRHGAH